MSKLMTYEADLNEAPVKPQEFKSPLYLGEKNAHTIRAKLKSTDAVPDDATCEGYFIYLDTQQTVKIPEAKCSYSNGVAEVTLTPDCYQIVSRVSFIMALGNLADKIVILNLAGRVISSWTDIVVESGDLENIPDLQTLVDMINAVNHLDISSSKSGNTITITTTDRNGIQTTNTISAGASEEEVADLKSQVTTLDDYVFPANLIDFESNASALSGLTIQTISKAKLKASRPSNEADAAYWIPISVTAGSYKFRFTFTSEDGGNLNIRLFDTNKSTEIKNFATSNQVWEYTFAESKTVYIRLYFLTLNKVLDITDAIIAPSEMFNECLYKKIGYGQLTDELSVIWAKLEDKFAIASRYSATGVTNSKDGNEVSLTTTADSSYIIYDFTCSDSNKYVLYYDVDGTYSGGNYSFQVRLFSTTFTNFIETVSQTSGASASGAVLINPASGNGGKFSINMPNVNGQSITGNLYLYDVTELSQEQIDSIDWENVGSGKTVFIGGSGSSSGELWVGKKVVFYGDSITQGSYPEKVQAKLGFTLVKNAYGGSRFGYSANSNSFSDDTRIAELPADADYVCIMGGTNDWQHTAVESSALEYDNGFDRTKFKGAVAYTVQKIQARCPSAKIYLLTNIGGRGNADPTVIQPLPAVAPSGTGVGNTPLTIRDATIEVADTLNIPVIDTWNCGINGFNRSTYIADTVHPTTAGYQLIADYIVSHLK